MKTDKLIIGKRYRLFFASRSVGDVTVICGAEKENLKPGEHFFDKEFAATTSSWTAAEGIITDPGIVAYIDDLCIRAV